MATAIDKTVSLTDAPISKKPLAAQVVAVLKRFILVEDLKEGNRLPSERKLSAQLGVSHRVIREALSVLEGEGILARQQGRGAFLRAFDRSRLGDGDMALSFHERTDVYLARLAVETGAVCVAAQCASEEDIAELDAILDVMAEEAERGASVASSELRFHLGLLRATRNPILMKSEDLVSEAVRLRMYDRPSMLQKGRRKAASAVKEHRTILEAVRDRDCARAVVEMFNHQRNSLELAQLPEGPSARVDAGGGGSGG